MLWPLLRLLLEAACVYLQDLLSDDAVAGQQRVQQQLVLEGRRPGSCRIGRPHQPRTLLQSTPHLA